MPVATNPVASPASTSAPRYGTPSGTGGDPTGMDGHREISDPIRGRSGGSGGVIVLGVGCGTGEESGEPSLHWQLQLHEDVRHAAALVEASARYRSTVSEAVGGDQEVAAENNHDDSPTPESFGCVRRKGAVLSKLLPQLTLASAYIRIDARPWMTAGIE